MGLIDGKDLDFVQSKRHSGCFLPEEIAEWIRQLCEAVAYAHDEGVIHQDIKPHNCVIGAREQLHLSDFGLSRVQQSAPGTGPLTTPGGTPGFSSPEQLAGAPPSPLQDVYSIGATIYNLLTGIPPRVQRTHFGWRMVSSCASIAEARRSKNLRGNIPMEWERTVQLCLALKPEDRPSSVREILRMLNLSSSHQPSLPRTRGIGRLWNWWR